MRSVILFLFLCIGSEGVSQNNSICNDFLKVLEADIVFNEYLTDTLRVEKINQLLENANSNNFDKKEIFLKYAILNLAYVKNKDGNDQALYKFVELTEVCDTTDQIEQRIYLGSLLLISNVLRENLATDISYIFIDKGIKFIERRNLKNYPWIQDFYNNAGVDLLTKGDFKGSSIALNKALFYGRNKDHLQDAMIEYNLAFLNFELFKMDSAILHLNNTCSLFEKISNLSSYSELHDRYAGALGALSLFYYVNNNFTLAQSSAFKAKSVFENIDSFNSGRYPHLYTLMNLAVESKNENRIKILLNEIDSVAKKVKKGKFNFYELLSESYGIIGNTTQEKNYIKLAYRQFQMENDTVVAKLQKYNSQLQSQILEREKSRFENERKEFNRKVLFISSIIALVLISFITILYVLYIRARNKKDLLEKEKEIARIEYEKTEIKSKLTESELNEKRLVTNQLASHIKLKQQTESAFLQKIKELKRNRSQNIEADISELQLKMMNLINIDQNFEHIQHVTELNQDFRVKLKTTHPNLSEKELQFCGYLLLNITTKELGSITNQSNGAIRVYKNRLKNKLIGKQEIDLVDYLQSF